MPPTKDTKFNLRLQTRDRDLIKTAAEAHRESMAQFMVESSRERAERELADRTRFVIDSDDWDTMVEAMDRPAQARPHLAELFSRSRPE